MMKRKLAIKLPGPRWLQFIVIVLLADGLLYGLVALSCRLMGHCSTVDWSNRMFWAGMAVFALGIPAVGASFMGLSGSTGIGTDGLGASVNSGSIGGSGGLGAVSMGMQASAMHDVIEYEQSARKKRMKGFWWMFAIGAGAMLISYLMTATRPSLAGQPPDFSQPDRAFPSKVVRELDDEIQRSIDFIPVNGVNLAVWDGQTPVFIQGYGDALEDLDLVYPIGGLTQQFTAVAILQLAEAGELSVDGVLTAYLPELPDSYYAVTLKHLLTHTSGLPGDAEVMPEIEALLGSDLWHSDTAFTNDDFMSLSLQVMPEPLAATGTSYMPSEQGYRLLGLVIEAVSGEDYNDYIRTHILEPAGLTATAPCDAGTMNLAPGFIIENGQTVKIAPPNTSFAFAAGNLCSTPGDLVQWQYFLSSNQLVSEESVAALYQPAKLKDGSAIKPDPDSLAGFGCTLGEDVAAGYYAAYTGIVPGYSSVMRTYYERNLVVVVMSDTAIDPSRWEANRNLWRIVDQVVWAMNDNWMLD